MYVFVVICLHFFIGEFQGKMQAIKTRVEYANLPARAETGPWSLLEGSKGSMHAAGRGQKLASDA